MFRPSPKMRLAELVTDAKKYHAEIKKFNDAVKSFVVLLDFVNTKGTPVATIKNRLRALTQVEFHQLIQCSNEVVSLFNAAMLTCNQIQQLTDPKNSQSSPITTEITAALLPLKALVEDKAALENLSALTILGRDYAAEINVHQVRLMIMDHLNFLMSRHTELRFPNNSLHWHCQVTTGAIVATLQPTDSNLSHPLLQSLASLGFVVTHKTDSIEVSLQKKTSDELLDIYTLINPPKKSAHVPVQNEEKSLRGAIEVILAEINNPDWDQVGVTFISGAQKSAAKKLATPAGITNLRKIFENIKPETTEQEIESIIRLAIHRLSFVVHSYKTQPRLLELDDRFPKLRKRQFLIDMHELLSKLVAEPQPALKIEQK